MPGYYNKYTGDRSDGNFYCQECGNQVPVGFDHHHAKEVPLLKARIAELEKQLGVGTTQEPLPEKEIPSESSRSS